MRKEMVLRFVAIGCVALVLLVVLAAIGGLATERSCRSYGVQLDIASSYAGEQEIVGPIVAVHYRERWTERRYNKEKDTWYDEKMAADRIEWVFPGRFEYDGELNVEERKRGIFKANVFQSTGVASGTFEFPAYKTLGTRAGSTIELVGAEATLSVSDARGITHTPVFKWDGVELEVAADSTPTGDGVRIALPDAKDLFERRFSFELKLAAHGVGRIAFTPIGAENRISLMSEWPHPSFMGDFLPTARSVSADGFSAEWNVNGIASSARRDIERGRSDPQSLGVELIDPVNVYSRTDRALKYGFLFIFITFAAFFLFEMLAALKIHPVQYGFVGFAQALFFLLLLSLSEHIHFGLSYLIASLATSGLIAFYLVQVLKGTNRGLAFGGLLALLYGVLYALLRSEDLALVAGSVLVFGLLALAMLVTRKIDWYALTAKPAEVGQ